MDSANSDIPSLPATMIPTDELEALLRGSQPRRPRASLKAALLRSVPIVGTDPSRALMRPVQYWLAPVMAGALLLLAMATASFPGAGPTGGPGRSFASLPANGLYPPSGAIGRNAPPSSRRLTNAGIIAPSFSSFLLRQTNISAR